MSLVNVTEPLGPAAPSPRQRRPRACMKFRPPPGRPRPTAQEIVSWRGSERVRNIRGRNETSHRSGARHRHWLAGKHLLERSSQIMYGSLPPRLAEACVKIIDAARGRDTAVMSDYDRLRRHLGSGGFHDFVLGVENRWDALIVELVQVPAHGRRIQSRVHINHGAGEALAAVLAADALDRKSVV